MVTVIDNNAMVGGGKWPEADKTFEQVDYITGERVTIYVYGSAALASALWMQLIEAER